MFIFLHYMTYSDPDDMVKLLDWLCDFAAQTE